MADSRTRVLVAQTEPGKAAGAGRGPLPVGLVRWPAERISVVVKATLTYGRAAGGAALETAELAAEQEPLWLARPSELPGAGPGELAVPGDLVPWKPEADVLLVGHAYAGEPTPRIDARVAVLGQGAGGPGSLPDAGLSRAFCVVGPDSEQMPLSLGFVRGEDGESAAAPVGPCGPAAAGADEAGEAHDVDEEETVALSGREGERALAGGPPRGEDAGPGDRDDRDYHAFDGPVREGGQSFAAPAQRCAGIPSDAVIELVGLSPGGGRRLLQLPGLSPWVFVETAYVSRPIRMICDTLWIDTDRQILVVVWRGQAFAASRGGDVERIVVSLERDREPRGSDERARELRRGHFSRAIEEADLADPDAGDDDPTVALEKYAAWEEASDPEMPLERYAAISAELSEQRAPRGEVLERHGLTEDAWTLEERAWLETIGDAAMRGDDAPAVRYSALLVAAQDGLATPAENERTLADYIEIRAAMEAGDQAAALRRFKMTLQEWARLDRRWTRAALEDAAVRGELSRGLRAARLAAQRTAGEAAKGSAE